MATATGIVSAIMLGAWTRNKDDINAPGKSSPVLWSSKNGITSNTSVKFPWNLEEMLNFFFDMLIKVRLPPLLL